MKIKHSKYKNTGILFELLVRQITADTLDGKDSPVKELLKKYFVKTELGKEYKLYETLLTKTSLTEGKANMVVDTLLESSKNINRRAVKKQKYNLISDIQTHYNLNEFFNHRLPNYKIQAAFYTLLEAHSVDAPFNPTVIINNKVTILEHLTAATITEKQVRDTVLEDYKNSDKDTRSLTYRIILEKFNGKYDDLNNHQKSILKELINSIDNTPRLKEFYSSKSNEIKKDLIVLNKNTKDPVTKIKINEVVSLIKPLDKNTKVTDNDLVNLLQYCDLLTELETANA
jgi:uncharacterized protein YdeI (YjbR/CyaY-like superfamily)